MGNLKAVSERNLQRVDITLEGFEKAFNRKPTQSEAATLMKLSAQKGQKSTGIRRDNVMDKMQQSKIKSTMAANKVLKDSIVVNKGAATINRLLEMGLKIDQKAYALHLSKEKVERDVVRYKFPRKNVMIP